MKDYRKIIKRKRESLGISQNKLAKQIGIAQNFLSSIESGRRSPSIETFFQLCEALDIKLFPGEPEDENGTENGEGTP